MRKKVTRGQSTKSETFEKKNNCKNVFLVSKTTLHLFEEKYEVFRHLIKDNKYENSKINKQYGQVRF